MAFFEWNNSMSVGNPAIDQDHKMLIHYVDEMHGAMKAGKGKDIIGVILAKLVTYTKEHFGREEELWKSGRYADFAKHKMEHTDLLRKVAEFKSKYDNGTAVMSLELMDFLRDWLINHILKSDKVAAVAIGRAQTALRPGSTHESAPSR